MVQLSDRSTKQSLHLHHCHGLSCRLLKPQHPPQPQHSLARVLHLLRLLRLFPEQGEGSVSKPPQSRSGRDVPRFNRRLRRNLNLVLVRYFSPAYYARGYAWNGSRAAERFMIEKLSCVGRDISAGLTSGNPHLRSADKTEAPQYRCADRAAGKYLLRRRRPDRARDNRNPACRR